MVVLGQSGCIWEMLLYSGKVNVIGHCGCIRAKVVVFGQSGFIGVEVDVFGKKVGCIQAK